MSKKLVPRILAYTIFISVGALSLAFTNPGNLPAWSLIIPFVYVFLLVYFITRDFNRFILRADERFAKIIPFLVATVLTLIILLSSLSQLGILDLILLLSLMILLAGYLKKIST